MKVIIIFFPNNVTTKVEQGYLEQVQYTKHKSYFTNSIGELHFFHSDSSYFQDAMSSHIVRLQGADGGSTILLSGDPSAVGFKPANSQSPSLPLSSLGHHCPYLILKMNQSNLYNPSNTQKTYMRTHAVQNNWRTEKHICILKTLMATIIKYPL